MRQRQRQRRPNGSAEASLSRLSRWAARGFAFLASHGAALPATNYTCHALTLPRLTWYTAVTTEFSR